MMRLAIAALFVLHCLVHVLAFAKAFGVADIPQLAQPTSHPAGLLWLTAAMVSLLAAVGYGFVSRGPLSLRAEFERDLERGRPPIPAPKAAPVIEAELALLPDPVQRYLRRAGVVGRPACD